MAVVAKLMRGAARDVARAHHGCDWNGLAAKGNPEAARAIQSKTGEKLNLYNDRFK